MKKLIKNTTVVILLIGFNFYSNVFAQDIAAVEQIINPVLKKIPGLNITILKNGGEIFSKGFGFVDIEKETEATAESVFRVYSIAKLWTVTEAARLSEKGKLNLKAPIQEYVPDFPEKKGPITTYHLATHSSGIRHYANKDEADGSTSCSNVSAAVNIFKNDSLLFVPGTNKSYSTWGFVLLSKIIENVANKKFVRQMYDDIFSFLGMFSTNHYAELMDDIGAYSMNEDKFVDVSSASNPSCKFGGGGFVSNSSDMAKFVYALVSGKLIGDQFLQMIVRPDEKGIYTMNGMAIGGRGFIYYDTKNNLIITFAGNAQGDGINLYDIAGQIAAQFN